MSKCFTLEQTLKKFKSNLIIDEVTRCWNWIGAKTSDGYGGMSTCFFTGKSKMYRAHRLSYMLFIGEIPDGKQILHKNSCNHKMCVNPDHLYSGTHEDNMRDLREMGTLAGENNPNFGVKCSDEKRLKLRISNTEAWKDPIIHQKYLSRFKRRKRKS